MVVDWSKSKVVLVLVRCESCKEDAIMVMTCASYPVVSDQDVKISTAIPVDQTFKYVKKKLVMEQMRIPNHTSHKGL